MQILGYKFAICRIFNGLSKGFTLKSFTRSGFRRAQLLGQGEQTGQKRKPPQRTSPCGGRGEKELLLSG